MLRKLFLILLAINAMPLVSSAKIAELSKNDTLDISRDLERAYTHFITKEQGEFFEGYTIQLFSGNRAGANKLKGEIIARGKFNNVRLVYLEPNFKIQIGSFPDIGKTLPSLLQFQKKV